VREEDDAVARTTSALRAITWALLGILVTERLDGLSQDSPRVRTEDRELSRLIQVATGRSATFRKLMQAIEATNGLVYVVRGRCGHRVRACLVLWMGVTDQYRILRVVVEDARPEVEAMASIGHELTHALEVLSDPSVVTSHGMFALYKRNGAIQRETFETDEAIATGNAVFNELRRSGCLVARCPDQPAPSN
jgi:hypothetical protein